MKRSLYIGTLMSKLFRTLAPKIGAKVTIEPKWNTVGQIAYCNGRKRYFRYSSLDLNTLGASEVAKDKDYANFFMKRMGYPTIPGKTFYSPAWAKAIGSKRGIDAAYAYAFSLGFPVIVKPNSGSQGKEVALACTRREFYAAIRRVFKVDRIALVQRPVRGKDYRLVVLDDKVISAYERIPLSIIGNGTSNVRTLLKKKQREFISRSRDTVLRPDDPRIKSKLSRAGYALDSVPARGARLFLLENANLSTGGDAVDVTSRVHPKFRKLAIRLTKDMGLRLCGVDIMVVGDISKSPGTYWVIEINSAPGLDHYAKAGKAQQKIVADMYLTVLKHMSR